DVAAMEILSCLKKKEGKKCILEFISKLKKNENIHSRWNRLLTAIFLHPEPECIELIYILLGQEHLTPHAAAKTIIDELLKKNILPDSRLFALYTKEELKTEHLETLFRLDTFSTCLYGYYCKHLLQNQLTDFRALIQLLLEAIDPDAFCLNQASDILSLQHQLITTFIYRFLNEFYNTALPEKCQELLSFRRQEIYQFLLDQPNCTPEIAYLQSE